MMNLILNTCGKTPAADELLNVLGDICGGDTDVIDLSEANIRPCTGCMSCQIKRPGVCPVPDDMQKLLPAYIGADLVVLVTPVFCGGYGSVYKKFLDRLCPVLTACFTRRQGETWHIPRYTKRPRMIGIGLVKKPGHGDILKRLWERNMRQLGIEEYADIIIQGEGDISRIRETFSLAMQKAGICP
jgi:hypothetical protein